MTHDADCLTCMCVCVCVCRGVVGEHVVH